MYVPAHFREDRLPVLHDLIRTHGFATLVALGAEGLVANHIPLELDAGNGPLGTLRGHIARANPLWKTFRPEVEALAIFHGPHGYISPSVYATKQETGKVVPTWNYAVVHAYGPLRAIEDAAWLRRLVEHLTRRYEGERSDARGAVPWQVSDAPEPYIEQMLKAIVGLELPIARLEGKWKVSQNRPPQDRVRVIADLRGDDDPSQQALAALVAEADKKLAP
jgi:transcriptional regulator